VLGTCDSEDDKERRPLHEGLCSLKSDLKEKFSNILEILIQEKK
jgi:hypothetical protein